MLIAIVELLRAHAQVTAQVNRRDLSAWGTVEQRGKAWSWRWTGIGLAIPELLPEPVQCVSEQAAWTTLEATVQVVTKDVRKLGAGG